MYRKMIIICDTAVLRDTVFNNLDCRQPKALRQIYFARSKTRSLARPMLIMF